MSFHSPSSAFRGLPGVFAAAIGRTLAGLVVDQSRKVGTFRRIVRPSGVNHCEHRIDKELNIQGLGFLSWGGHGAYHTPSKNVQGARQARFRQRLAQGLQTLFSYAWAYGRR